MNRFVLGRRALSDLEEIWSRLSNDNPENADRVLENFYGAFSQLAEMPRSGHARADLTDRDVLFWRVGAYLVIYKVSNPLRIARIIHGRRDLKNLLKSS